MENSVATAGWHISYIDGGYATGNIAKITS